MDKIDSVVSWKITPPHLHRVELGNFRPLRFRLAVLDDKLLEHGILRGIKDSLYMGREVNEN